MDALRLGPLVLPWGPIVLVLGYAVAVYVAAMAQRHGRGNAEPVLLPLLVVALVAARTAFVLRHRADYPDLLPMLDVRDGGFDSWPGWAAGLCAVAVVAWRRPHLRRSLPVSSAAGAAVVLAAFGVLRLFQPPSLPLPSTSLPRLGGGVVALRSLQGRPLVINLWATWCPPCRRELPMLVQAAANPRGVRIVLVNEGEAAQTVGAYLRAEHLHPPEVLLDPTQALMAHYRSPGFPTTLFIGADGRLRAMHVGELSAATLGQGLAEMREAPGH
jgi:thiol-disulfide isomerase/thioredoxin